MKFIRLAVLLLPGVAACSSAPTTTPREPHSDPKSAALISESVAAALAAALRLATIDPATGTWSVSLSHDLHPGDYKFPLPKLTEGLADSRSGTNWVHHPGNQTAGGKPEDEPAFDVRSEAEPNDSLLRFAFSFRVRKIHTLSWLEGKLKPDNTPYTLEELDPLSKLYEFQIYAFQLEASEDGKIPSKRLIGVVTTRASIK